MFAFSLGLQRNQMELSLTAWLTTKVRTNWDARAIMRAQLGQVPWFCDWWPTVITLIGPEWRTLFWVPIRFCDPWIYVDQWLLPWLVRDGDSLLGADPLPAFPGLRLCWRLLLNPGILSTSSGVQHRGLWCRRRKKRSWSWVILGTGLVREWVQHPIGVVERVSRDSNCFAKRGFMNYLLRVWVQVFIPKVKRESWPVVSYQLVEMCSFGCVNRVMLIKVHC